MTDQTILPVWASYLKTKSSADRDKLASHYYSQVKAAAVIFKNTNRYAEIDDLIGVGSIALLSCLDAFDPRKFSEEAFIGNTDKKFRSYLTYYLKFRFLDYARKNRVESRLSGSEECPKSYESDYGKAQLLKKLLDAKPPYIRELALDFYVEKLNYKNISKKYDIPVKQVKSILAMLQRELKCLYEEPDENN